MVAACRMQTAKDNLILRLTFEFSLEIIKYTEKLEMVRKFNLANQLFRSGTSIGANVREAQGCESRNDFVHKMKMAYKKAEETRYWLELCSKAESYPSPEGLFDKIISILRILGKIIHSSKS